MRFAVFLDVDGVLNSRTTRGSTPEGYTGIDDFRVELLANAVKMYEHYELILTSDWKELEEDEDDYVYLLEQLELYGLSISGKTEDLGNNRGEGVIHYMNAHPEIEEYVILDDQEFDFGEYAQLWNRLLLTEGIERAELASTTPEVETRHFLNMIREQRRYHDFR